MKTKIKGETGSWIILLLIAVALVLPARFFQTYSVSLFNVKTNLSVNYVNFVDLFILFISFLCVVFSNNKSIERKNFSIVLFYGFICFFYAFLLTATGNASFIGELISKSIIVLCSCLIAKYVIDNFAPKQFELLYVIPLSILVISSFFLQGYMGYGSSNRVGSLGFGSNETAIFACILLAVFLFKPNASIFFKAIIVVICFSSLFVISSRRGILIGIVLLGLKLVSFVFEKKRKISVKSIVGIVVICFAGLLMFFIFKDKIIRFFDTSALLNRFRYSLDNGASFSLTDRFLIFKEGFGFLSNNILFGSFGCDTLYAQGNFSHAHNVFLQFLVTYGLVFGIPICLYFLSTIINSIKLLFRIKHYQQFEIVVPCCFILIYIVSEQVGYMLWNPKALLLVMISVFIINYNARKILVKKVNNLGIHTSFYPAITGLSIIGGDNNG